MDIDAEPEKIAPWRDKLHAVEFFADLDASSWEAAVVKLFEVAMKFDSRWEITIGPEYLTGTSTLRKVDGVVSLTFEMSQRPVDSAI